MATAAELASVIAERLLGLIVKESATDPDSYSPQSAPRSSGEIIHANLRKAQPTLVADLVSIVGASRPGASDLLKPDRLHRWVFERDDYEAQDRKWDEFTLTLRSGSRFFNDNAWVFLEDLFKILKDLSAGGLAYEEKPR